MCAKQIVCALCVAKLALCWSLSFSSAAFSRDFLLAKAQLRESVRARAFVPILLAASKKSCSLSSFLRTRAASINRPMLRFRIVRSSILTCSTNSTRSFLHLISNGLANSPIGYGVS